MIRRSILFKLLFLFPVVVFLLAGCGKPEPAARFTLATLKGPSSMGMIRLIDSLKRDPEARIQVEILNEPLQVRKMMIDGTADLAILPSTMGAIVYNKGMDYRLIAVPVWGTLYLVGSDSTVTTWKDLVGKRVFVMARGMTPDILFRYLLHKNGLEPAKDVTLDYSFPTHIDLAQAVRAGKAPLAILSEPQASLAMQANLTLQRIFSLDEEWKRFEGTPLAETAFLGRGDFLRKHPEMVEKLLASYARSTSWVNAHPDSAAALIVSYGILPDSLATVKAIPRINLKFVRAGEVEKEVMDYFQIFYHLNPEIIGGKMPDEDFIYR
ncbi:MAG: ABC transporter substrate-binding protein [Prolixibacteraceae bacterium]|jgi:NitT/TauT family transport system substrate-binding protein|nr:ABC transporter substrate-binding protein [Prolixibacteraceae bacterium]HPJ77184.1 ABC transporter substrate-binding protein [Prolixibacteraceae bacterium]